MPLSTEELESLALDLETDRVERKESASDGRKIRQAICAFSNDLPSHGVPGVIFIGLRDDASCAGISVSDKLLLTLAAMRDDGNIVPIPSIRVDVREIRGCRVAVIEVDPADAPPVRCYGEVRVRVGPRRAIASADEERRLNERRRSRDLPYDVRALSSASMDDLSLGIIEREYIPAAFSEEVLAANERTTHQRMRSLKLIEGDPPIPTAIGVLLAGISPADYIPGAYAQFVRFDGETLDAPINDQKEIHGPIAQMMQRLDDLLDANIQIQTDITTGATEIQRPTYPKSAIQQVLRNAIMHRNYETSFAPTRINWFNDRIEITSPGGPFGQVTIDNFGTPGLTDYRNPNLAAIMKDLGFVQRFGVGIQTARQRLRDNGNPDLQFEVEPTYVLARLVRAPS